MPTTGVGVGSSTAFLPLTAGGGTPPWTPLDLGAKLHAFFNVYDEDSVLDTGGNPASNGEDVGTFEDLSGNARDALGPAGNEPTLRVSGASRYLEFAGTDRLDRADSDLAQTLEIWAKVFLDSVASTVGIVDAVTGACALYFNATSGDFEAYAGGAPVLTVGAATVSTWHILRLRAAGASSLGQADGGAENSGALGTAGLAGGFRLGQNAAITAPLQGRLQAVVITNAALTAGETTSLQAWFDSLTD